MKEWLNRLTGILGILLMAAGTFLIGHYAWGSIQVALDQHRMKAEFEQFESRIPHVAVIPDITEMEYEDEPEEKIGEEDEDEEEENSRWKVVFEEWAPMRLTIPIIDVDYVVLTGEVMSRDYLDKGIVHYEMSDLPSTESGNVAIAGHRGGRWRFFLRLNELEYGDEIFLHVGGYRFVYTVTDVFIVEPDDWSVVRSTETPSITLTTCEPWNRPATHRLIARAELFEVLRGDDEENNLMWRRTGDNQQPAALSSH